MIKLPELLFQVSIVVNKHVSKKNDKEIRMNPLNGKRYIGTRKKTADELSLMSNALLNHIIDLGGHSFPLKGLLQVKLLFHYPDTLVRKRKTMPDLMKQCEKVIDLSNLIQGVEDCLQSAGVIKDDKQIESYDGSRRIYGSKEHLIEVFIYSFGEDSTNEQ